jgi:FlaA1/EpsC-like NDP-sugar epimerase
LWSWLVFFTSAFRDISRFLFLSFALLTYLLQLLWRVVYYFFFITRGRQGVQQRSVIIVGAGLVGREVEEHMLSFQQLGIKMAGFLDDDPSKYEDFEDILGSLDNARSIVLDQKINDVIIALPLRAYPKSQRPGRRPS